MTQLCPCGSSLLIESCCLPYIEGAAQAPTAEVLMRARYTAYAIGRVPYIVATSHPDLLPPPDPRGIEAWCKAASFLSLKVTETQAGGVEDDHGYVRFIAWFIERGRLQAIQERSRFERVQGEWRYHSGQHHNTKLPGPNDPCPCGSGSKFKKCHGA